MKATALIAEDEPLLAQALRAELRAAWPELDVVAVVADGHSAVREALDRLPQVLFLDIRMPGLDGLGAAMEIADRWPATEAPMPQLVFVTAYDEYAVQAFDAQAIDYVRKPVQSERLRRTVGRVQQALAAAQQQAAPRAPADLLEQTLSEWRRLIGAAGSPGPSPGAVGGATGAAALKFINASDTGGNTVHMVAVQDVLYFEAADKYVRVLTAGREYLIRTPLKQLLPQLDANIFWQVHRAVLVRSDAIEQVQRDESGKLLLSLRGRQEKIVVSRLYAHLFRAM